MALKRKRSSAAIPSPFSDCSESSTMTQQSTASAIPNFYFQAKPVDPWCQKPTWSFPTYEEEPTQLVNSRTRKRHRDDRPDEQLVYERTMSRLFDAQRQAQHPAIQVVGNQSEAIHSTVATAQQPQRSTLHSFWNISQQPPTHTPMAMDHCSLPDINTEALPACTDCDGPLRTSSGDDMDIDMNIGLIEQEACCFNCGFIVCDGCAILGDQRACLMCATHGGR